MLDTNPGGLLALLVAVEAVDVTGLTAQFEDHRHGGASVGLGQALVELSDLSGADAAEYRLPPCAVEAGTD